MPEPTIVTLSPEIVAELEPVAAESRQTIEAVVNTAIAEYLRHREKRPLRDQLAQQYEQLAAMWNELADDIAEEEWLAVENEALRHFEKSLDE